MLFLNFLFNKIIVTLKYKLSGFYANYQIFSKWRILCNSTQTIRDWRNINIGKNFNFGNNCQLIAQGKLNESKIEIGRNVALNSNVIINADFGSIKIGDDVRIGPNSVLRSSNHNFKSKDKLIFEQGHTSGKIIIGSDVWVASNVVITDGAVIGRGSVISAGARVSKNFPEFSVIGGINKIIKKDRSNP